MWRNELRGRDAVYWDKVRKKEVELVIMLETREGNPRLFGF